MPALPALRRPALGFVLAGALSLGVVVPAAGPALAQPSVPGAQAPTSSARPDRGSPGQGAPAPVERKGAGPGQFALAAAPAPISRSQVIARAETWVGIGLGYNQGATYQGYRRDCSGYVSMAWQLATPGQTTNSFGPAGISRVIGKSELKPGDALNNDKSGNSGHVVLFEGWADSSQSSYWGYEFSGSGVHHRKIPYPYFADSDPSGYKPIRNLAVTDDATPAPTPSTYRGDIPIVGDWDGRGHTQVGVFRNSGGANQFVLRHDDGSISSISLGDPGDQPIVGDWDGTGHAQVGVFRSTGGANQFILRHDDGSISSISLGDPGDQPIIGDWQGTGRAQVGVFRSTGGANEFIMRNADGSLNKILLGDRGDQPVIGRWDGGARDLPGIFRRSTTGGANTIATLHADGSLTQAQYGIPGDLPVIGDWSGAGRSSYGIYRPGNATFTLNNSYAGAPDTSFIYGNGGTWS
ncbi:hypothetical protein M2167_001050 [Streptomyces sp. SPB4]|nr:hypothetical protein [Streptomyces sp. SPB4]